jgi:hypothetical protein
MRIVSFPDESSSRGRVRLNPKSPMVAAVLVAVVAEIRLKLNSEIEIIEVVEQASTLSVSCGKATISANGFS